MRNSPKLLYMFLGMLLSTVAFAEGTPDGETPANEGVCDELVGFTPGLYGLCVAFCEAQDCEVDFDPVTGELVFDPSCTTSSPKVLDNYTRRMGPDDPFMPCVNIDNGCPCWTEDELDQVADASTRSCGEELPAFGARLTGTDLVTGNTREAALTGNAEIFGRDVCFYREFSPDIRRLLEITPEELDRCNLSLLAECAERGF